MKAGGHMRLSVLDQLPIAEGSNAVEALSRTARLAQEADKLGYHRFWVAEHHYTKVLAGSSPEVLISHLAARTTTTGAGRAIQYGRANGHFEYA